MPVKLVRDGKERTLSVKVDELLLEAENNQPATDAGPSDTTRWLWHHAQ